MSIVVMNDNGLEDITARMDGAFHNLVLGNTDVVVGGIGNQFSLTHSTSSLVVTVASGLAVIGGRYFYMDAPTQKSVSAGTTTIMAHIDISQAGGNEGSIITGNSPTTSDLNDTGTVRDLPLYRITATASGVTNVVDLRPIWTNLGASRSDITNLQTQITQIENSLGDQADFIIDGSKLTIVLY